ncbi:hypothetical protein [Anaerofustis sp. NSJ-163]|nr:hypothetical protein [Anaerofustis sp. NSJ-163]MCO8194104.1 hypothetical protein [Anaerofustis sp. NSJ-163]
MLDIMYMFFIAFYCFIFTVVPSLIIVYLFISTRNMDMFINTYTEIVKKCDDLLVFNLKKENSFVKHKSYRKLAGRLVKKNIPKKATYDVLKPFNIIPSLTNIQVCNFDNDREKYIFNSMLWYYSVMREQPIFNRFNINYYNLDMPRKAYVDRRIEIIGYILLRELIRSDKMYDYKEIKDIILNYYDNIFTCSENINEIINKIKKEIKNVPEYLIENMEKEIKTNEDMFFELYSKDNMSKRQKQGKKGLLYPKL